MGATTAILGLALLLLAPPPSPPVDPAADNEELARLMAEDQADRQTTTPDWAAVAPRDRARLARVKALYAAGAVRTANDYYRAALVLQHGDASEDFLLAHEFCVAAMVLGKNDRASASLAAAAEDRFLMKIGRPQRFGTQYRLEPGRGMRLYEVAGNVSDELRRLMSVPSLSEAKAFEAELNANDQPRTGAAAPVTSSPTPHAVRHIDIVIARAPADVYAFASDPANLQRWAAGLARSEVRRDGEAWIADSPMGTVRVRFVERNALGVLDHDVTLPSGVTVHNPMRVVPHADGSLFVFTLIRRPGMSDEEFAKDAAAVENDLATLKKLLEAER